MKKLSRTKAPFRNALKRFALNGLCLVAILSLTTVLKAQNSYGSIVGTVADSSGAVVPAASVTVTNIGTGQIVKVHTDDGGKYSVADLLPADYAVTVEKSSFKRTERADVMVEVGAVVRIDVSLAIGNANEIVVVTSNAALLQTDTSSLSQEVEGDVVQQMPLNGRNVMNLVELAPGVVPSGGASGSTGLDAQNGRTAGGFAWNNYQIGGGIQGWSADYIDGVPNQLLGSNQLAMVLTQDAIQEFNVVSSNATADFGRFGGGVINMSTKSGTNAFHGSAYEFLRNSDFNANQWFNNHSGLPRVKWNQNQYGANATGPIKRDKAFFLFTWENFKILSQSTNTTIVPSAAMQSGVFNTKTITDPLEICDIEPYTGQTVNGQSFAPGGTYVANLYQGGCGDPLNEVLKQYYPLPNATAAGYNWLQNTPFTNSQRQYNGRGDYQITPKQRFFARYTWWHSTDGHNGDFRDVGSPAFGSTTPTTWHTNMSAPFFDGQQGVVGDTYTINPTTVLDVRANYIRQVSASAIDSAGTNESQFDQYNSNKYYAALSPFMNIHSLPVYQLNGNDGLFSFKNAANFNGNWANTYSLNASLTKILGSHSLKVGVEARLMDNSGSPYVGESGGFYNYSNVFTGDEFAAFLLGYPYGPTGAQFQNYQNTAGYSYYQGYYVMDDWQASRKLTLNLGLRYELPGATAERNNKLTVLLPHTTDPYTGITGTEALVNSPLYHHRPDVVPEYNLFAPRVGFAYRASESTTLHGGWGMSYIAEDLAGLNGDGTLPVAAPFNSVYTTVAFPTSGTPEALQPVLGSIAAGSVTGSAAAPLIQANPHPPANFMTQYASLNSYKGQILAAPYPYQSYPTIQQWNLGLSHQFKGDMMASVSYAGLKGINLPEVGAVPNYWSVDELQSQYYSMGPAALSAIATSCPNAPGLVGSMNSSGKPNFTVGQCLRPNPYYADMEDTARYTAKQGYKSFQTVFEKRFRAGGVINANYSWARNMSNTDSQNQQTEATAAPHIGKGVGDIQDYNNPNGEYSLISYDVKNRLVIDYELPLPFGKGQKYGNNLEGFANAVASGWAINGITIFQSGFPLFLITSSTNLLTGGWGGGYLRPSVVPGCNKKIGGSSVSRVLAGKWYNTSCFVFPGTPGTANAQAYDPTGQVTFGNEPRVDPDLRGDGIKNFDFAFQKATSLGFESASFVFRAEFFNVLNRVQYCPPVQTYGTSNFGSIIDQCNSPRQIQLSGRINF